jgi:membrane-bound lytic murein transglycosylase D
MKNVGGFVAFFSGVLLTLLILAIFSFMNDEKQMGKKTGAVPINTFYAPKLPQQLSFAGEPVPITREDVKEKFDKEFLKIYFDAGNMIYLIKLSNKNFPVIEERLRANGVPDDFKYLCIAESNMQSWAASKAGAVGYWQFMPSTASGYGLDHNSLVDERRDLQKATDAACKFFIRAYKKFGNWTAAAASYNCGMGGYNSRVTAQHSTNYYDLDLPEETNKYMHRILSFKYILENAGSLGYIVPDSLKYTVPETKIMEVTSAAGNLNQVAEENGISYKELQWYNPWIKGYTLPANKLYHLMLPVKK